MAVTGPTARGGGCSGGHSLGGVGAGGGRGGGLDGGRGSLRSLVLQFGGRGGRGVGRGDLLDVRVGGSGLGPLLYAEGFVEGTSELEQSRSGERAVRAPRWRR